MANSDKRNAAQIFLDEWSTMEKKRPTLKLLQELLIKAELFRAADYVACDILKRKVYNYICIKLFLFLLKFNDFSLIILFILQKKNQRGQIMVQLILLIQVIQS